MKQQEHRSIIIVQYSSNAGGSTFSALLLAKSLLSLNYKVHVIFGFSGEFEATFQSKGCTTEIIPHNNWLRTGSIYRFQKNWILEIKNSRKFKKLFNKHNPSLIYINSLASFAAAMGAKYTGIPVIWHIRELFANVGGEMHPPPIIGKQLVRFLIRNLSNEIICISKAVAINILGKNLKGQATIIHNVVDQHYFKPLNKKTAKTYLKLPLTGPIIGIPGTLRPMKGHNFVFESTAEILKIYPNATIAISGDLSIPYAQKIIAQAKQAGIYEHCNFLGTVKNMRYFYASSDVICIPSSSEPFGRTVIESFASQRPVIGSDVGGIKEIISNGSNGFLVKFNDTKTLSNLLKLILGNHQLANTLSNNAKECANMYYNEHQYNIRIKNLVNITISQYGTN